MIDDFEEDSERAMATVTPIKPAPVVESPIETIERVVADMRAVGADHYKTGILITIGVNGRLEWTPLGTVYDNVEILGVMVITQQSILDSVLGP